MRRELSKYLAVLLAVCLLMGAACAQTVRGDLSERFDDVSQVEYEGTVYSLRNRLTVVLLMGILPDEALGADVSDFTALLIIDDDERRITPLRFDGNMLTAVEGEAQLVPLREVYALGTDREDGAQRMVEAVNGLLGQELITAHLAFEVAGANQIEGYTPVEGDAETQLRALKAYLEQKSMDELNDLYALLGDYIITDMKSGAAMKVMDKSERYEVLSSTLLPTRELAAEEGGPGVVADEDEALKFIVSTCYEEKVSYASPE